VGQLFVGRGKHLLGRRIGRDQVHGGVSGSVSRQV
jgi:hypothetical protein